MGNRKMKGFYISTAVLFVVAIFALYKGADATELVKVYSIMQGIISGGFFAFNFGEHYAASKAGK